MKAQSLRQLSAWGIALWLTAFVFAPSNAAADEPRITSVRLRDANVVVTVSVPSGIHKITLESRLRFGSGTWQPRAVQRLDGSGGEVSFQLPRSEALELLRVRADASEPLPTSFYKGTNKFGVQPAQSPGRGLELGPGTIDAGTGTPPAARTVEESDLWKRRGNTLYVFNQYRGLRVIDETQPDQARIVGTLDVPAMGDQMYLLGDNHAVLLARDRCGWDPSQPEGEVLIVDTSEATPKLAAKVPVKGRIMESRLVGTALYLASQTYQAQPDGSWLWGVVVTSIDLTTPASPVERDSLWFSGYGQTVAATPEFFFVAALDADPEGTSTLHCLDITASEGQTREYASLRVFGRVPDKFKIDWVGGILRVVSERQVFEKDTWGLSTRLETFRLPDPRTMGPAGPAKLGEVELVRGESVFASRFDGPRAYVVTYRRVDPLWVVDLADPLHPRVAGALHVPGWSTYIQPLGDRLLAVGIDDTDGRRVAVSLFDVKDPAAPALLKRISLGEQWSWSEANYEEKAVTILPELGLLMLPYMSYGQTGPADGGTASRVKLIDFDLTAGSLTARGEIPHQFDARRTMLFQDRVLSLSSTDLSSVDISNRDEPVVRQVLPIAWPADQLILAGPWLLELATGSSWAGASPAAIRVAPANTPGAELLSEILPGAWPIIAADAHDGRLYIARAEPPKSDAEPSPSPNLELRVYDLGNLPDALPLVSETRFSVKPFGWSPKFIPLWLRPDLLVLAGGDSNWWWWGPWWGGPALIDSMMPFYGYPLQKPGASRLLAVDVTTPTEPKLASDLDLARTDRAMFSSAFAAGDLVYVSHATFEAPGPIPNPDPRGQPFVPPEWYRVWRHQLTVVDFADAMEPTVRRPVDLPGSLQALGAGGNLVFTLGNHWQPDGQWTYDNQEWVDAVAYDGVEAHLVASLKLPVSWPHPIEIGQEVVWLGRAPSSPDEKPSLESWKLNDQGEFALLANLPLAQPADSIRVFGSLLASQGGNTTQLFDIANPASPGLLTTSQPEGCLWANLNSAVGEPGRGVWFPVGLYGVQRIPRPTRD